MEPSSCGMSGRLVATREDLRMLGSWRHPTLSLDSVGLMLIIIGNGAQREVLQE
jgi:hypothetical protein